MRSALLDKEETYDMALSPNTPTYPLSKPVKK